MLKNVKNKSAFMAEAIKERIEKEEKLTLVKELSEGYSLRRPEDKKLALEWDSTSGDGID
ncbi:MAG: hypothetical protein O8C66_12460 [Candidatus Methanoperedens sp.]|nr:hypothetical protein [Candidatus Methanoperedens sp.]MCZ7371313.1 hypothetical protein [Candidatus Methanoperedens sp.]